MAKGNHTPRVMRRGKTRQDRMPVAERPRVADAAERRAGMFIVRPTGLAAYTRRTP